MGLISCPETSVTNHQPRQRSIPEGRRHQLLLDLIMGTQNTTLCQKNANQLQILVTCTFGGPLEWGAAGSAGVLSTPLVINHNHNMAKKHLKLTTAENRQKCVQIAYRAAFPWSGWHHTLQCRGERTTIRYTARSWMKVTVHSGPQHTMTGMWAVT